MKKTQPQLPFHVDFKITWRFNTCRSFTALKQGLKLRFLLASVHFQKATFPNGPKLVNSPLIGPRMCTCLCSGILAVIGHFVCIFVDSLEICSSNQISVGLNCFLTTSKPRPGEDCLFWCGSERSYMPESTELREKMHQILKLTL